MRRGCGCSSTTSGVHSRGDRLSSSRVKAAKHLLFVAGMLGVIAMFLPLLSFGKGITRMEVSAKELSFGLSRTHALVDKDVPFLVRRKLPPDLLEAQEDVRTIIHASRGAALAFIPAALMLLAAVGGMWRGYLGRRLAAMALVCGIASIAAYFGLKYGLDYGENEEPLLKRANLVIELGAYFLIIAGLGGIAGGIAGIVRPEAPRPRRVAAPAFPPPHVPPPPPMQPPA